jgi:hypothetical protein
MTGPLRSRALRFGGRLLPLLAVLAWPVAAGAQPGEEQGPRQARATRIYDGRPPVIDGVLEPFWERASFISNYREGMSRSRFRNRTEVGFLFDHEALYVAARLYTDDPASIRALVGQRDDTGTSEAFVLSLDTYRDRRTAYSFEVTAGGARADYYHPQDQESPRDRSFDPVWQAATAIDSTGWTAEMRIPFSQLRFHGDKLQVWGLNWSRWIPTRNRRIYWIRVPAAEPGWASRFGELVGIHGVDPANRVEILPYVTSRSITSSGQTSTGDGWETTMRGGVDLKAGAGFGTLDVTVNPDFGQIEADPAEVNLSAYETFFPERRPFFLEGSELLRGLGPRYFYSRRIGAPPSAIAPGEEISRPESTTILGAAKFTGQRPSGLAMASLLALTSREEARVRDLETGDPEAFEVEPVTGFGALRLEQRFGPAGSTVGAVFTGVRRALSSEPTLAQALNRQAYAGGADWNLRWAGGEYALTGHAGFSHVEGDSARILQVQQSSVRFFQRPDADHVDLDPSRTTLTGYAAGLGLAKQTGDLWQWRVESQARSPGFEINDLGSLRTADDVETRAEFVLRERQGEGAARYWTLGGFANSGWNFGGVRQYTQPGIFFSSTWRNEWRAYLEYAFQTRADSDELTRGGPLMRTAEGWTSRFELAADRTSITQWRLSASMGRSEIDDSSFAVDATLTVKPGTRWEISLTPGYSRVVDHRQFFTTLEGGGAATFGRRYIFSNLDFRTMYAQFRTHLNLTPEFNLGLYAEPFVSSGRFTEPGELPRPGALLLRRYGTDGTTLEQTPEGDFVVTDGTDQFTLENADFNARSFRSTFVLRWEWLQGSSLFFIWQRDFFADLPNGDPVGVVDLMDALRGDQANGLTTSTLALKLTYWFPID